MVVLAGLVVFVVVSSVNAARASVREGRHDLISYEVDGEGAESQSSSGVAVVVD
jgi:hypothetical protein